MVVQGPWAGPSRGDARCLVCVLVSCILWPHDARGNGWGRWTEGRPCLQPLEPVYATITDVGHWPQALFSPRPQEPSLIGHAGRGQGFEGGADASFSVVACLSRGQTYSTTP